MGAGVAIRLIDRGVATPHTASEPVKRPQESASSANEHVPGAQPHARQSDSVDTSPIRSDHEEVRIRIEGTDLPGRNLPPAPDDPGGRHNVHVAIQGRRGPEDLYGLLAGDAGRASWEIESEIVGSLPDIDLRGPQIQGRRGGRFIYLTWGTVSTPSVFSMFRRAKLMLDAISDDVMQTAVRRGLLVGRLSLIDETGWPVCAAVRPPRIDWSDS